ncbi:PP2C family protein-serine/threonine phosphatase [Enemella sp. A6]|uniref:PP2C family protein-serine/threonine phosphatase n=1 Tax=Enemella sp. A6 TaxID=3440152 RepID=UPI003EBB3ADF
MNDPDELAGAEHLEQMPASWVGVVCDRGQRHAGNEDASVVVATPEPGVHAVLVVCDGVSSAPNSAEAAAAASQQVSDALTLAEDDPDPAVRSRKYAERLIEAIADANRTVVDLGEGHEHAPSCTVAAAVVSNQAIVAGWAGDSRVYWFPDEGDGVLLTTDDSMAQLRIEWGVEREQAEQGPGAHTITRWLGRDAPTDPAHTVVHEVDTRGWVVVCSDGLWNYASEPEALGEVLRGLFVDAPDMRLPVDVARELVAWANRQGGEDNITVAVARLGELINPESEHSAASPA